MERSCDKVAQRFPGKSAARLVNHSRSLLSPEHLLGFDAEVKFVRSLKERELSVEQFANGDMARIEELLQVYHPLNLGFVDACTVAVAERLKITEIATTHRQHFSAVKPKHCPAFTLLP